jgi:hypothetical protein
MHAEIPAYTLETNERQSNFVARRDSTQSATKPSKQQSIALKGSATAAKADIFKTQQ